MTPLRIGAVPYLNARPLVEGLAADPRADYLEAVPARLADLLREGRLDAALVSSVESIRIPGAVVLDAPCIASEGPVWSVRLIGREDPRLARRVALDGASRTAAALARIVYATFLGRRDVAFREVEVAPDPLAQDADATLVIGDRALIATAGQDLDLGAAWSEATGLPFVWAVWLAREGADRAALETVLREARERGGAPGVVERHAARAAASLGLPLDRTLRYLDEVLRHDLGDRERAGLERFLALARALDRSV